MTAVADRREAASELEDLWAEYRRLAESEPAPPTPLRICARCARSLSLDAFTAERPYACRDCQAGEARPTSYAPAPPPTPVPAPVCPPVRPARHATPNGRPPRTALGQLRVRAGLTQNALARRIGVDPSIVGLWELGRRAVPWTRRDALAAGLGLAVDELAGVLSGKASPPPPPTPPPPVPVSRMLPLLQVYGVRREELPAQVAERMHEQAQRLVEAGMTPARRERSRFYLFCLQCGRGVGPGGVLDWRRGCPPTAAEVQPCQWCGGKLLLEEFVAFRVPERNAVFQELRGIA